MASSFVWIDDSEEQRQRMEDALGAFSVRTTRDELGLSVVRDAFSDMLFPGTGALQTRAAYFLFVPWMYRQLEEERVRSVDIDRVAKRRELDLVPVLLASDDSEGTIGKRAGQLLKRLPSSVYWSGLGRLRVRRFRGSQDTYHRSLDGWNQRKQSSAKNDDGELADAPSPNWHAVLPEPPGDWPKKATLRLRSVDAVYLRERIRSEARDSLFARMEGRVEPGDDVQYAWNHPVCQELERADDPVSCKLRRQVHHATCFSEMMHGAAILYNLIVAEQLPGGADMVARYTEYLAGWLELAQGREKPFRDFNLDDLWRLMTEAGARVHPRTRDFVTEWVRLVRSPDQEAAITGTTARRLITLREKGLKGPLARIDNSTVQARWEGDSSLGRMDFRWSTARTLLSDILSARERPAHA
jgi:hypothetical protein